MVSKRQKLARKRFKETHPDLFPAPQTTPPKGPTKKKTRKLKNPKFKKSGLSKHPLRVPGLRPGEACFICKGRDHVAKNCPEKALWEKNKTCLLCRQRGHSMKNCPNKQDEVMDAKMCYNCGKSGHSLSKCPKPLEDGGTKFAHCFICKERGHLSKNCPKNTHGIYPKGGCCKLCGQVTHLVKDCPNKGNRGSVAANRQDELKDKPRGKLTKFISGDDLVDDFMMEEKDDKPNKSSKVDTNSGLREGNGSVKKRQGPKVVNFVG